MQQEIYRVVEQGIVAAQLVVDPKGEMRERPGLAQAPHFGEAARRLQERIGENAIIVKVKARSERSPKNQQRRGEKKKPLSHRSIRAYGNRPKTAAERQARVAEILLRLDHMYP